MMRSRPTGPAAHGAEPLDPATDHVRGAGRPILEYGDYECPYSRAAYHATQRVERELGSGIVFAFRHFPLSEIHPHALKAAAAAEAAALQHGFWEMHDLLFLHQAALERDDLLRYADELELDRAQFDRDLESPAVVRRIGRDIETGLATGEVRSTPTLFIDGVVYRGAYDMSSLLAVLAR